MKIEELSNYQIVTITVAILGGETKHVDEEDIAIKADELASGKFNWRKYPNRINLVTVRVALDDAKKLRNKKLLIGNHVRGWMLNSNGLRWIIALKQSQEINDFPSEIISRIHDSLIHEKERLLLTNAYNQFINGNKSDISRQDFFEFTRTNEYFKTKANERRYTIVGNAIIDHFDLIATWNYLQEIYLQEGSANDKK